MQTQNITSFTLTEKELRNFNAKIAPSATHSYSGTPCLVWTASKVSHGYGMFWVNGKTQLAHRIAWILANGVIPADKPCVLHHCDNPPCCNDVHLFLGTQTDNARDKEAKGRGNHPKGDRCGARTKPERLARGEKQGNAKLCEADIPEIFALRAAGLTLLEMEVIFGVGSSMLSQILRRNFWAHVNIRALKE